MIRTIINLIRGRGKWIFIGTVVVLAITYMGYSYMKIQTVEATLEAREQRVEYVESQYDQLEKSQTILKNQFTDFVSTVNEDLEEQRMKNNEIRELNSSYESKIDELEKNFLYDEEGEPRDWDKILDEESENLQDIINKQLRGIGNEFENIGSGNTDDSVDRVRK